MLFLKENKRFQFFKIRIKTDVVFELNLTTIQVQPKEIILNYFSNLSNNGFICFFLTIFERTKIESYE